jgi:DNA mismatch repair protein MutS2
LRDDVRALSERVEEAGRELAGATEPAAPPPVPEAGAPEAPPQTPPVPVQEPPPLGPGDKVRLAGTRREGRIERLRDEATAVVRLGKVALDVPLADLTLVEEAPVSPEAAQLAARMRSRKAFVVPTEIVLIGMTVDEALHELEKFLDDALLAGHAQVRIVHGKGTGALRQAVHQWLREHPAVRSFALAPQVEGGHGVTLADL